VLKLAKPLHLRQLGICKKSVNQEKMVSHKREKNDTKAWTME